MSEGQGRDLIRFDKVAIAFGRRQVLREVTFSVREGETLVVLGPSGTGKSVTLRLLVGLMPPDAGEIIFDDLPVTGLSERELNETVRRRFGMLFQGAALFDSMSVRDNIAFALTCRGGPEPDDLEQRVAASLRQVGLDQEVAAKMPADLSGGMKKRVGLARAVVADPDVILYDEPTTGLDPIMADAINDLILRIQRERRATSVVVTHDMASAYKVADRMVMLYDGRIVGEGTPDQIRDTDDPMIRQFIEGRATGPIALLG